MRAVIKFTLLSVLSRELRLYLILFRRWPNYSYFIYFVEILDHRERLIKQNLCVLHCMTYISLLDSLICTIRRFVFIYCFHLIWQNSESQNKSKDWCQMKVYFRFISIFDFSVRFYLASGLIVECGVYWNLPPKIYRVIQWGKSISTAN